MYCPECGSEFRVGFSLCSDCEIPLVHEPPPEARRERDGPADDVVVFSSDVPGEADMIAAALEQEGILCSVRRGIAGGLQLTMLEGGFTPGQSLVLSVPRLAETRAREIVESMRPELPAPGPPLGDYGEERPTDPRRPGRVVSAVLLVLFLGPLALAVPAAVAALVEKVFQR